MNPNKSNIDNPFDNLFEQMANISKASAYDIVCKQRDELLAENEILKGKAADLTENSADSNNPTYQFLADENRELKEQLNTMADLDGLRAQENEGLKQRNEKLLEALRWIEMKSWQKNEWTEMEAINAKAIAAIKDNTPVQEVGGFAE